MSQGREHGLRTPTPEERARASGLGTYLDQLGLAGRELFDAIGTHFDPRCLQQRVALLLRAWSNGLHVPRPAYPDPNALKALFDRLHAQVRAGHPWTGLAHTPFRSDVMDSLEAEGLLEAQPVRARD